MVCGPGSGAKPNPFCPAQGKPNMGNMCTVVVRGLQPPHHQHGQPRAPACNVQREPRNTISTFPKLIVQSVSSSKHLATSPPSSVASMSINKHGSAPSGQPHTQTAGLAIPPACAEMCAVSTLVLSDRRRRPPGGHGSWFVVGLRITYSNGFVAYTYTWPPKSGRRSSFGEQSDKVGTHLSQPVTARPNSHGSCHVRTHRPGNRHPPTSLVSTHCNRSSNAPARPYVSIHHGRQEAQARA